MSLENDFKLIPENKFFVLAVEVMLQVKSFLLDLTKNSLHFPHLKIVYSVSPLIELMEKNTLNDYFDIKRIIYAVMTELNSYVIEFCNPPDHNYLAFNNMDFGKIGLIFNDVGLEIKQAQTKINNSRPFANKYHDYLSIRSLSSLLIRSKFEMYANRIKLNWKGKQLSVGNIDTYLMDTVSSPYKMYSLYLIYMKFCLAATFFEIYEYFCIRRLKVGSALDEFSKIKDIYPTEFVDITENVYLFMSYFTDPENNKILINNLTQVIKNQFTKIGVSIIAIPLNVCYPDINKLITTKKVVGDEEESYMLNLRDNIDNITNFVQQVNFSFVNNHRYIE